MRRLFVVFLILLFPLNVLALSLSASSMQQGGAPVSAASAASAETAASDAPAVSAAGGPADGQAGGDIDPDEPPSSGDLHEPVDEPGRLRLAALSGGPLAPYTPPLHDHPSFAPIKPPPRG
ncbi:hypothetical protein [Massilia sp. GCM10023247]|uniref:hypothetical protein n=1 Tax=Massilia sp. GCM10023247 TaxID=3252643 RepID=UPI003613608E